MRTTVRHDGSGASRWMVDRNLHRNGLESGVVERRQVHAAHLSKTRPEELSASVSRKAKEVERERRRQSKQRRRSGQERSRSEMGHTQQFWGTQKGGFGRSVGHASRLSLLVIRVLCSDRLVVVTESRSCDSEAVALGVAGERFVPTEPRRGQQQH